MASPDQLPHLLQLLDDDSPVVQKEISRALHSLGPNLARELDSLDPPAEGATREKVQRLVEPWARDQLLSDWPDWQNETSFEKRLENGLGCIAAYQTGTLYAETLPQLIGELSSSARASGPLEWARELFQEGGLSGNTHNYYHPRNSNLVHVIKSGMGNPISLTCIYILTSKRLGWQVEGCNNPGHFLARASTDDGTFFVDCFNAGRPLTEGVGDKIAERLTGTESPIPSADSILTRVLRNLVNGHCLLFQKSEMDLYYYLAQSLSSESAKVSELPNFAPGDLVQHKRYGYRGVVVEYDLEFRGEESWYRSNRTQPDKDQPWYNVLVDGTEQVTYAAQTSLEADTDEDQVMHPLVPVFFSGFKNRCYWRNGRAWIVQSP